MPEGTRRVAIVGLVVLGITGAYLLKSEVILSATVGFLGGVLGSKL